MASTEQMSTDMGESPVYGPPTPLADKLMQIANSGQNKLTPAQLKDLGTFEGKPKSDTALWVMIVIVIVMCYCSCLVASIVSSFITMKKKPA